MDGVNVDMMEVDSNAGSSVGNSSKGVSFEELAQIYDNAKKQANFFVSISELLDCTTNETQRNRIRQAKWDPLTIRGTEYCAAFIKTVFPICTNSSKVATIFEASAISETGLIRKVIDRVFYYSTYKNNQVFMELHDSTLDTEEDAVFPWYGWVHQSLKIPLDGKETVACGIHDFTCWLLFVMCKTAKSMDSSLGIFGKSDLPAFVIRGADRFIIKRGETSQLRSPILNDISSFIPKKVVDIQELMVSQEKPGETRMQTRASTSRKASSKTLKSTSSSEEVTDKEGMLDFKPSLRVAVVFNDETGEDAVQIDLTNDNDEEISYMEELKAILEQDNFTMRQKEALMDQILCRAKENIRLKKSKINEMEKEYEAMTSIYGPVRDQMDKDYASERLCKETVESFGKIGKTQVEVDKVHMFFKSCNIVLNHLDGFRPGTKPVIKRKPVPQSIETGEATGSEKENVENATS